MKEKCFTIAKSADVAVNKELLQNCSGQDLLRTLMPRPLEATSLTHTIDYVNLLEETLKTNHFLLMLEIGFNTHKPITICPDHIWLLICQGFADHIKINADLFKNKIVFDDTINTIQIRRDDFVIGGNNPWEEILPEFSKKICEVADEELYRNIALQFSTTTPKEATAFEISFLDAMSAYFSYEFVTLCGIPHVKIMGETDDYILIHKTLEKLKVYNLDWWVDKIQAHLEKIIQTLKGEIIPGFWQSIYKENNESGGPYVTGWIVDFFPYLRHKLYEEEGILNYGIVSKEQVMKIVKVEDYSNLQIKMIDVLIKNPKLLGNTDFTITLDKFPRGISQVPFKWQYLNQTLDMSFIAGFIGIKEDKETHTLDTDIHWVVCKG